MPDTALVAGNMRQIGYRPRVKANTAVLPKEHNTKMSPDDILVYSGISELLRQQQRRFLLQ